jgi:dTDP-4-amino-4,6-dideoxygalactose transaminase
MTRAATPRAIGGFFGLELPSGDGGLRTLWRVQDDRLAFVNASSALASLVKARKSGAVWLPASICPEFARAVAADRLRYYPLDADLSPRVDFLREAVRAGDLLVGVDFFGRLPGEAFIEFTAARPDVLFIEDCAQAIDTGRPPWGDWRLFSPRKLVGVPDGGLLVPCSDRAEAATVGGSVRHGCDTAALAQPQLARFEDAEEADSEVWHAWNRAKEEMLSVSDRRASRLSWTILGLLDPDAIVRQRRRNFETLASRLSTWSFLPETAPRYVPFGFPVRLPSERRDGVRDRLYRHRVFPAVHWASLPSSASEFPDEHALASGLLTLPCDQRYGDAEMERVADLFLKAVG